MKINGDSCITPCTEIVTYRNVGTRKSAFIKQEARVKTLNQADVPTFMRSRQAIACIIIQVHAGSIIECMKRCAVPQSIAVGIFCLHVIKV